MIGYIPSPSSNSLHIGPVQLHFYGLIIAIGVLVAAWLTQRRWAKLGGFAGTIVPIGFWAVVAGLVGARLYSVITSWQQDTGGSFVQAFEIWNGGLGIWGGVSGGVLGGWIRARRLRVPLPPLLDVVAPALAIAQAIGRWGNYFNQELFGLPSKLPWAVRITNQAQLASISPAKYRTALTAAGTYLPGTFQPTFLYESIWDLATCGLLLLIERKIKLRRGYLFAVYAALYTFGRFWTEYLRIDPAHRYLGLRFNDWTSIGVFAVASAVLLLKGRPKPGDALVGEQLPADVLEMEQARGAKAARRTGVAPEAGDADETETSGSEPAAAAEEPGALDGAAPMVEIAAAVDEVAPTADEAEPGATADDVSSTDETEPAAEAPVAVELPAQASGPGAGAQEVGAQDQQAAAPGSEGDAHEAGAQAPVTPVTIPPGTPDAGALTPTLAADGKES